MNEPNEKVSATHAAGYIAGVGIGLATAVLRMHFWVLLAGTAAFLVALIFIEAQMTLLRSLAVYVAFAAGVFGHALLRRPTA